ncbi:hypothetical protein [Roseibacillus persicicus]|uniref:hypothetical protein n=1 Tax=Roseibacillus persicicus TaxID=454148 RepID=UPI00280FFF40|nr:hypothetical protein [Roseibacillus persicicus]MDQ8191051.1 hypothetical protein [Roseibacillus persicicus]
MAFYPERWEAKGLNVPMIPWASERVTLVTTEGDFDRETLTAFLGHLDDGWALYEKLTAGKPRPLKVHEGKPTIVALPANDLSCGYGCGYVGATGIEMTRFYDGHYPALQKNPKAVPHAYFYEMGRNFYTFGDRHSCFTTGFAVFMRYVCVETLGLVDNDKRTKDIIVGAVDGYEKSDLGFVEAFTTHGGLSEKVNRLKDENGKAIGPTDQNVIYASLLLKLRQENGGNDWVAAFFKNLRTIQPERAKDGDGALRQCVSMLVCSSVAAKKDLSPLFCDRYRLPLDGEAREVLSKVDWSAGKANAGEIISLLPKKYQQGAK